MMKLGTFTALGVVRTTGYDTLAPGSRSESFLLIEHHQAGYSWIQQAQTQATTQPLKTSDKQFLPLTCRTDKDLRKE